MPWPQAPVQGSCGSGVILVQSWGLFLRLDFVLELVKVWPLLSGCSRSFRVLEKPHGMSQEWRPEGRRVGCPAFSEGWDAPTLRWLWGWDVPTPRRLWEAGISARFSG